jgi:cation diffusion facilitator CzcD-associated flavoprotein CzcO
MPILITAGSNWKWPDVPGLQDFEGDLVHTAAWPKNFDYKNRTVAVIGNGASGVQLLPAIRPGKQCQARPLTSHS